MRKVLGFLLVALGFFGLAMAILLPTVVVDRSKKTPLDLNITQVATGPAKLFDAESGKVEDVRLRALRRVFTDSSASDGTNTTVSESLCVAVDDGKLPKDKCPTSRDPRLLTVSTDRVTANRRSGESVHVPKYREAVNGDTSVRHKGLSYKFPIDTEKRDYQLFSADLGKAFPAKYVGTAKVGDLDVYKFESTTGKQPYTIKGTFPGTYDDTRTIWVEPKTGVIVNGTERQIQTLENGQVALDTTLSFTKDSVDYQSDFAQSKIDQLQQAQLWGPIIAGVVAVLAFVGAYFLLRGRRDKGGPGRGGSHRDDVPPSDPDDATDDGPDRSDDDASWFAGGPEREPETSGRG